MSQPSKMRRLLASSHCFVIAISIAYCAVGWMGTCPAASPVTSSKVLSAAQAMPALVEADWIDQDRRFAATPLAALKPSPTRNENGVTTEQDATGGCDGIKNGRWGFHTASGERDAWWQVDLQAVYPLDRVVIFNRMDRGTASRTRNIRVLVSEDSDCRQFHVVYQHDGTVFGGVTDGKPLIVDLRGKDIAARVVRLEVPGRCSFALDEVEVYANGAAENIALHKPADQKSVNQYSYPGTLPENVDRAIPSVKKGISQFTLAHTKDAIRRGHALAKRLKPQADADRLNPLVTRLDELERDLAELEQSADVPDGARQSLYFETRRVVREIAFCNPLLNIDRLLFLKRHESEGVYHMCDQFYGCNARPGGGLYVLEHPFGSNPQLVNLLEDSVVENGRLKGRKLDTGSFLSPEVSFDGKTILFAYTQAKAWDKYHGKEAYEWSPEFSYHIFKCNADGSGLVQLTDGPWDDFDPCFLPNGRIVFVSERRGGFLRCGRHCPVYTLHSMEPDGSDIVCISYHETHEWNPSVTNDGMLVYTRWDYVDRDTNVAHHIWTSYPDGRDPRSFHGNYPERRESRPWMEMSIRAIPDSRKFVASTGAHHGHQFGSLVLIDQSVEDDGAMSQLTRLTPETPFPEAEGGKGNVRRNSAYGTPWPLSERDFLCVFDPNITNRAIYWIDTDGNKELIYRDPAIACASPIPLRSRKKPPVIPDATLQTVRTRQPGQTPSATIAVANVHDTDFQWPDNTRIAALRVIQVLPKTTAPPNQPRIGVANQTNARAVLGTVPIESDGSAYFEVPAGKELYFQALDENGLAIQSMRSGTYVHAGERLVCHGCHEHKHRAPALPAETPLALKRPPSTIQPDVDGSRPFSYVRLVQPVLDHHCVACHQEKKALDLTGVIEGKNGFSRSYNNLAAEYGFYFHVSNGSINTGIHGGSRTIPGQFGARAAKLLKYMDKRHYNVTLSKEDYHRLTLWLDCNSEFFGAYENTVAQSRGELIWPSLD